MLQDCYKESNIFSSGYTNFETEYYTSLDQILLLLTGFADRTIQTAQDDNLQ